MISTHGNGLRAGWILGLAAIAALGCPASDDSGDEAANTDVSVSADDSGSAGETMTPADSGSSGTLPDVDYVTDIQPIWDENCVSGIAGTACHQMGGSWATNDLTPENSYENLLTADALESLQPFVEPGDLDGSYLWHKVNATWMGPPANGVCCDMPLVDGPIDMPMDPGPLSQADLDKIEAWIVNGANP
ncbi:MAG TPA: hypothetical protein VFG69_08860 [Nannocystaceae bacterium]|nr:hypothetical protein [Nannocystaceae bacterium]